MTHLKYRARPLLLAAVAVMASTGAAFRGN